MKNETAGRKIVERKLWKRTNQETSMAFIKKPPENVSRSSQLEKPVSELLDDYRKFVDCTPDYVANFALRKTLARDPEYRNGKATQDGSNGNDWKRQGVPGELS
jgi:hypothetical protein